MKTQTKIVASTVLATVIVCCVIAKRNAELEYAAYDELRNAGATGDDWVSLLELVTGRPPVVELYIPISIPKDDAFRCIRQMHNLESLTLAYDSLTDEEISTLSNLRLNSLTFNGNYPTDEAVSGLLGLSTIRFMDIPSGNLSDNSIQRLRLGLPSARIEIR